MERKKASALALSSLLMVLLAPFALVPSVSSVASEYRYIITGGSLNTTTQLYILPVSAAPFFSRPPDLTPMLMDLNITFNEPREVAGVGWIVDLTVEAGEVGLYHEWYDSTTGIWFTLNQTMPENGYGWIFLNNTGDVDCYTFSNDTGAYWGPESSRAGELAMEGTDDGTLDVGADGVPGTPGDGFGDGTNDTRGSSIVILPMGVRCEFWDSESTDWEQLFYISWPIIFTTGTSYNKIIETDSVLNLTSDSRTGQPWEFFAGLDHPGYGSVPYGHAYWNAYVCYASVWSYLAIYTNPDYQYLDVFTPLTYKLTREDCVLPDIKFDDEEVSISDVRRAGKAYDTYDESSGPNGKPEFPFYLPNPPPPDYDDIWQADALFDAAADVKDPRGWVGISDVRRVAKDYLLKLTPQGIQ